VELGGAAGALRAIKRDKVIGMSAESFTFRREQSDSRKATAKFACRLLWLPITYANLPRIIVWALVISISLVEYSEVALGKHGKSVWSAERGEIRMSSCTIALARPMQLTTQWPI
jgi:hypothetical protein